MIRVLCIEDDAETRILLKKSLESVGMSVDGVWGGDKGIEAARSGVFDCILLDIMMPGLDGFEVLQLLKEHGPTSEIPVVIVTALDSSAAKKRAMEAGANGYVLKPFDLEKLVALVERVIKDAAD